VDIEESALANLAVIVERVPFAVAAVDIAFRYAVVLVTRASAAVAAAAAAVDEAKARVAISALVHVAAAQIVNPVEVLTRPLAIKAEAAAA